MFHSELSIQIFGWKYLVLLGSMIVRERLPLADSLKTAAMAAGTSELGEANVTSSPALYMYYVAAPLMRDKLRRLCFIYLVGPIPRA